MKERIVIDVETNAGATDGILTNVWCIGVYYFESQNKPFELYTIEDHWVNEEQKLNFAEYLQEVVDKYVVVFHNALFDMWVLEEYFCVFVREFDCTLLMSYVAYPGRPEGHSLGAWGSFLGFPKGDWDNFSGYSPGMGKYCERDCRLTAKVFDELRADAHIPIYRIEKQYLKPLRQLNHNGVYIDVVKFDEVIGQVQDEANKLLEEVQNIIPLVPGKLTTTKNPRKDLFSWEDRDSWIEGGYLDDGKNFDEEGTWRSYKIQRFNPSSGDQVAWALHTLYGWEPERFSDKTGKPTADKSVLEEVEYPLADLLLQYSEVNKLCTTYGESLKEKIRDDGRLHADFNHCITRTGRLSSSKPNLELGGH